MTDHLPDEPALEETQSAEREEAEEAREPGDASDVEDADEIDADEVEQELLDAMKKLRRTNKKVEEYLDGIAREVEKPAPEQTDTPAE
jgi:hypothetical protein